MLGNLPRRFIFNIFMTIMVSVISILALIYFIFFFDAFETLDKVQSVVDVMEKEVAMNNGFLPEHIEIDQMAIKKEGDAVVWGYTFKHDSDTVTVNPTLVNNGVDKHIPPDKDSSPSVYSANLYQSMLLEAISGSEIFTDAYVSKLKCVPNPSSDGSTSDRFMRANLQFYRSYDSTTGNLNPLDDTNADMDISHDECYIAGQKGDWIEVTVILHTSRSFLPIPRTDTGETITIDNVSDGDVGHDVELTFTVPCMRYVSSGRYIKYNGT